MKKQELNEKINNYLNKNYDNFVFLISGRATIDLAIKNAMANNPNLKKAYLPNYICDSMVKPFIDNGMIVEFYAINFDGNCFNVNTSSFENKDNIIVLYCDYFISSERNYKIITQSLSKSAILIHDVTHTLFSGNFLDYRDDYLVCSMRKWFPIEDGGLFVCKNELTLHSFKNDLTYLLFKEKARQAKEQYYANPSDYNKKIYESLSDQAESVLNENYSLNLMSLKNRNYLDTIDLEKYFQTKRELFNMIKQNLSEYQLLAGANDNNCIFTFPLVNLNNRDEIFKKLRNILIRCAVMWDFNDDEIYKEFVDKSICVDISENTIMQLRRYR